MSMSNLATIKSLTIYFLGFLLFLTSLSGCHAVQAATVILSGTVYDEGTGLPSQYSQLGVTRVIMLGTGGPGDEIPVEAYMYTDENGYYELVVDDSIPGLDQLLVFTCSSAYDNELYDDVQTSGIYPTYSDVTLPGVVIIDLSSSVSDIDFWLQSRRTTYMVTMTDGIHLATDVYLPYGTGPWPVSLYRTPYNKNTDSGPVYLLDYGYAVVTQDCRGRFSSEGEDHVFYDDGWGNKKDGYDTTVWILNQFWCDGNIGTSGGSARGITQNMLAGSLPPGLKCQHVGVATSDFYSQATFQGGSFRKSMIENWLAGQGSLDYLPTFEAHPNMDDQFWPYYIPETRHHLIDVPIVNVGGWYDIFLQGTINNFVNIQHNNQAGARGKQKLIIEPYGHGLGNGGFYWPEDPVPATYANILAWHEYWLKGINTGVMDQPPVCYYVLGDVDDPNGPANEWRFADDWPVPAYDVKFYLHQWNLLNRRPHFTSETPDVYIYDPEDPVPTIGGANLTITRGPYDQRPVETRSDVILFTTPVLQQRVEITGKVLIRLFASSTAIDTDFTGKLCDVYPDGRSMLVCDGIIRARHRNSMRIDEFLIPAEIYEFEIDLWEMAISFNAGHRIRVAISSSNFPRFDPNPNTGEPFRQNTHVDLATNTIYHDVLSPSHLLVRVTGPDTNNDGIPDIADQDGDSMDDDFEWHIVDFDPNDAYDSLGSVLPEDDFDGDGWTNYEEFLAGTDPTTPNTVLPVLNTFTIILLLVGLSIVIIKARKSILFSDFV